MDVVVAMNLLLADAEEAMGALARVKEHGNRIVDDGGFATFEGTPAADAVRGLVRAADGGIEGLRAPVGTAEALMEWARDD